ncbi:hypothetical protein AK812_SmicGene18746 [Symbiodinium microadriaticum]|uniref:Uncharacterized protein n=1 Tax=Symbiodinium microadriaticum TaxID=2951 RepID=A0A1Q9DUB9_SYMMI|nr:hypothetical protein AK812_SmicGene18746 [Symbiodinium microadriaticum]CAE7242170.1 unnamed protein product [Symbiodinium microadriaticum]
MVGAFTVLILVFCWESCGETSFWSGEGAIVASPLEAGSYQSPNLAEGSFVRLGTTYEAGPAEGPTATGQTPFVLCDSWSNGSQGTMEMYLRSYGQAFRKILRAVWFGMVLHCDDVQHAMAAEARGDMVETATVPKDEISTAGRGKSQAKGEGKQGDGKGKPSYAEVVKPTTEVLPKPPTTTSVTTPKPSTTSTSSTSVERQQLEALMKTLGSMKETLPPETLELYEKFQLTSAQDNSKELHKAVTLQSTSRKQLIHIRTTRLGYLAAWQEYLVSLTDIVKQQVEEQDKQLLAFDEAEVEWSQALERASADLARLANGPQSAVIDVEEEQLAEEDAMIDSTIQTETELTARRQQHSAEAQKLVSALEELQTSAVQRLEQATKARDGSRTPRRRNSGGGDQAKAKETDPDKGGNTHAGAGGVPG